MIETNFTWCGTIKELQDILRTNYHDDFEPVAITPRALSVQLRKIKHFLLENDKITFIPPKYNDRTHYFYRRPKLVFGNANCRK